MAILKLHQVEQMLEDAKEAYTQLQQLSILGEDVFEVMQLTKEQIEELEEMKQQLIEEAK